MALTNLREEVHQGSQPPGLTENEDGVVLRRRRADWRGGTRAADEDRPATARRAAVSVAAATLAAYDGLTGGHSDDVVTLCDAVADEFDLPEPRRSYLLAAAQLHDIGKVAIASTILEKPGPLDADEWQAMRRHTVSGEEILLSVPELSEVGRIVRHSHERWDGSGYPDGLAGEEIPLESRIVFCADAFHAIRSDRPYRGGRSAAKSIAELRRNAGTQFDPRVVDALEGTARTLRRSAAQRVAAMTDGVRSRRLVALLLTLAVGGSAMAAPGSPLQRLLFGGGDGQAQASTCPDPCLPARLGGVGHLPGVDASGRLPGDMARGLGDSPTAPGRAGKQTPSSRGGKPGGRGPSRGAEGRSQERSGVRGATGESRGPDGGGSTGSGGSPSAGVPSRPRLGGGDASQPGATPKPARPLAPGRSGEAPRRPASPGKPTGPGPGRSGEAPGKPAGPGKFGNGQR